MDMPLKDLHLVDKQLICVDCNKEFIFEVGEQLYFLSKGLAEPKRCAACRKLRKDTLIRSK